MSELVMICVDCGTEFSEVDGWGARCATCCVVLDDHLTGVHAAFVIGCVLCDDADRDAADVDLHRAVRERYRAA
ncbi:MULTISPECIES: hypothetical protein [Mumia]|uniref:hypothetical protein n=1 Tax=Mumia TaxID=1546255 RepID=UPI00142304E6|nr:MULTISPECIES: hypothetical protein [unclassified Mumia]QMW66389.1 hypothetical protein H4N58_20060 [Mumia sp. ZJ1417]